MKNMTRENWLNKMASLLKKDIESLGYDYPKMRVSCGLPSKKAFAKSAKTIGQCWDKSVSNDNTYELFISPTIADSSLVAATLVHEIGHAVVGLEHGHRKPFKEYMAKIGLTGKATATFANESLKSKLNSIIGKIGDYPHAEMNLKLLPKQGTRLLKFSCKNVACDYYYENGTPYSVRLSRKVADYGEPICGCCSKRMEEE